MVGKWMCQNPLNIDERKQIKRCLELDLTYKQISHILGRSKSVIAREAKRLGEIDNYDPDLAQSHFETLQASTRGKISETIKKIN